MSQLNQQQKKDRRAARTRSRISGTSTRPRLSVHRTAKHLRAQVIDDAVQKTLVAIADHEVVDTSSTPVERAKALGLLLAKKAKEIGVTTVVFDRGSYRYHGRVASFAEGAREGGLEF